MKKDRTIEIQYYDWRLMAWLSSETRDRLDAAGRGIYRELLDHCYAQGSFPDDQEWMRKKCAATPKQMAETWPIIEKHFPLNKEKTHHENIFARIFRKKTLRYIEGQKKRSKLAADKYRNKSNLEGVASGSPEASLAQRNVTERNGTEGKERNGTEARDVCVRTMPRAADLDGQPPQRFDEVWELWPRKTGRDSACRDWISCVTLPDEPAAIACARRYLASDEVARGAVRNLGSTSDRSGWIVDCARDKWRCDWPAARASPGSIGHQKTRGQEFEEMVERASQKL